jgi:hypothetical protein
MRVRQRHDDALEAETPFMDSDVKKARQLFDMDGNHPVTLSAQCVLQHAAVVVAIVLLACVLGFSVWFLQNDESYDPSKVQRARPPW